MESVKQYWARLSHGPFLRLVRHCVERIFSGNEGTENGELDLSIATILALLATPGAFVSLFCMDHYGSLMLFLRGQSVRFDPYAASAGDEYFFIVLAMVVAGAVAVWKWDRLVPDRRDYLNLAPLPVSSSRIFLANLTALSMLAVVLSFDLNAASSFLFPLVVCAQQTAHVFEVFLATHTLTIVAASAFGFLAVFALLGTLMALVRKIIFTFVVPALAVCMFVYSLFWGWRLGMTHTALVAVWSVLLMEGLLAKFRKIPFTCSLPKFKSHVIVSAMLVMLGYLAFTSVTATVESWALADPLWFIAFVPVVLGVSGVLFRLRKTMVDGDRHPLFEEQSITIVEVINLGR